jgi:hypothetical protein
MVFLEEEMDLDIWDPLPDKGSVSSIIGTISCKLKWF